MNKLWQITIVYKSSIDGSSKIDLSVEVVSLCCPIEKALTLAMKQLKIEAKAKNTVVLEVEQVLILSK